MVTMVQKSPVFLFLALFLAGCAASSQSVEVSYDDSSRQTTYETAEMQLEGMDMTTGLQKEENRFYVRATASCEGKDCVPSQCTLDFIKEGPQPVSIAGKDVTLQVGTETLRWKDPQTRKTTDATMIRSGTFVSVKVSNKQLATIGGSSKVYGTVGGEKFTIPHQNRAPIRMLLSKLEKTTEESSQEQPSEEMR